MDKPTGSSRAYRSTTRIGGASAADAKSETVSDASVSTRRAAPAGQSDTSMGSCAYERKREKITSQIYRMAEK
jgi:hypothetical protein